MKKTSFFDQNELDFHLNRINIRESVTGRFRPFGPRSSCEVVYKIDGSLDAEIRRQNNRARAGQHLFHSQELHKLSEHS